MAGNFVMDNSVSMSWCFEDEAGDYSDAVLDRLAEATAVVPSIWPLEVVNVLLVAERKHRISESDSIRFLTLLSQLPIAVEHETPDEMIKDVLALARTNSLSSYDAAYLDLAMRKGLPLATLDNRLIEAARKVGVPILTG
jgi:predicted nucleic acid-binding protein